MSEAENLPIRPDLGWYKKSAKKRLEELRARKAAARLADAQLAIAHENGFPSWRKLKARIDQLTDLPKLFEAIYKGNQEAMRPLLKANPGLSRLADPEGRNAIHIAAECNNPEAIEMLLFNRADPESYLGQSAHNALSWSITVGSTKAANALLRGGIQPDLFCAAGLGDVNRVRSFFDSRGKLKPNASHTGSSRWAGGKKLPAPPSAARDQISDALYFASRNGQTGAMQELLTRNPNLSFRAFLGATALHWAYFSGVREAVELLLRAGAGPTLRDDEYHCTPRAFGICVASGWGYPNIFDRVLRMDPNAVNIQDGRGTPLHEAAREGHAHIVQALLAAGADPAIRDAESKTALDIAQAGEHQAVISILQSL